MEGSRIYQQDTAQEVVKGSRAWQRTAQRKSILQKRMGVLLWKPRVGQKVCGLRKDEQLLLKWCKGAQGLQRQHHILTRAKCKADFLFLKKLKIGVSFIDCRRLQRA